MRISVAMATYNGADYIIEQLDSIRNQTRQVDEVIISDDHSPDGTYDIVKKYIEENNLNGWRVIYDTVGKGLKDNFYSALNEVTGDIVFLADQDNIWYENKVEELEKVYIDNPKIKCVNNSFLYIDKDGKEIKFIPPDGTSNNGLILQEIKQGDIVQIPLSLVLNKNIGPGLCMSVKRDVIDIYLKNTRKVELHDFEINCIAANENGLFFYHNIYDGYRIFDGQSVSVGIVKKRSKREVLKEKIQSAKNDLDNRLSFIEELIEVCSDIRNSKYLTDMLNLYKIKHEVVFGHKLHKWIKEKNEYIHILKTYGNIDMRYCYIDLLAGLKR